MIAKQSSPVFGLFFTTKAGLFVLLCLYAVSAMGASGCGMVTNPNNNQGPADAKFSHEGDKSPEGGSSSPDGGLPESPLSVMREKATPTENDDNRPDPVGAQPPNAPTVPPLPPATVTQRQCADKLDGSTKASFGGAPCKDSSKACASTGCIPVQIEARADNTNNKPLPCEGAVLCVGASRAVKTLQDAFATLKKDTKLTTVQLDQGLYLGGVSFAGLDRALTIRGATADNPPVIFAPQLPDPSKTYAALSIEDAKEVVVEQLVLTGWGHGLTIRNTTSVKLSMLSLVANTRNGAFLYKPGAVEIQYSRIVYNGAINPIAVNINGNHLTNPIAVNINGNHLTNPIAVNINGNHLTNPIAVNINGNHLTWNRLVSDAKVPLQRLAYGLVIQSEKKIKVHANEIARNGAGGVAIWHPQGGEIAVNIKGNHIVWFGDDIVVNINGNHLTGVELSDNHVHHNGPVGRAQFAPASATCDGGCPGGSFCEGGVCHAPLSGQVPGKKEGTVGLLGVGVVVAGHANVNLQGNSFFRNDTSGLLVHSAKEVSLEENVFERNGVRPKGATAILRKYAHPAAKIWGVQNSVSIQRNMMLDNVATGLRLVHRTISGVSSTLKVSATHNNFSGNGHLLPEDVHSFGGGLHLITDGEGSGIAFDIQQNFFSKNRRAGLGVWGAVRGTLSTNLFKDHRFRAITFHDTGKVQTNTITIEQNTIDNVSGFAIQVHSGDAKVKLLSNLIKHVHYTDRKSDDKAEGDGINLTNLSQEVVMQANAVDVGQRSAFFLDASKGLLNFNTISSCTHQIVLRNGATVNKQSQMYNSAEDYRSGTKNVSDNDMTDAPDSMKNRKEF